MKQSLPDFLRPYFWDVEFEKLDTKNAFFVIKRVLDRGNTHDVRWLIGTYGLDSIKQLILKTRDLDRSTGNFWADVLGLNKNQVPCLQKPYSPIHFGLYS